ncbi:DUF4097 domain-containing protein [Domibacillus sp. PGB-M46]|uniref:DUF4097 family beta strand repeat-containing protein n=1 Tax=Domibacillus sp. PGB-M46 TaxID=2910255 RepID=UPI001F561011|nr:DUF4097 family beta strand repeat-containing protein [Domibacillus sp. PGB-M46]MCI2253396.1 DUF4097 domain-containing protein [Domibacillus sp. PGB-M46]
MIKKLSVAGLILLLVGGAGSALTFSQAEVAEKRTISVLPIRAVELETDNAEVEVLPTKETAVRVELAGKRKPNDNVTFQAEAKGDTLVVKVNEKQNKLFTADFVVADLTLHVYLPEKTYDSIDIANHNGQVELGQLNVRKVNVQLNNGKVNVKNTASNEVKVKADNGEVLLEHVDGTINGKVANGRIRVLTKDLDRPMRLESYNGSITVQTGQEPTNTTFDVHKDNGEINILNKYSGNTRFGDGENIIKLKTNNGKITVTK